MRAADNTRDPAASPAALIQAAGGALAQVLMPCEDLAADLDFFVAALGFRVEAIFPADDPRSAILSGYGLRLHLLRTEEAAPAPAGIIEIACEQLPDAGPCEWRAPGGTLVRLVPANPPLQYPRLQPSLAISRDEGDSHWSVGRAGLRYRDLIPDRHGGAFIASHIRVLDGGPVPDYVHHHHVRFQTIFCRKGWVRVVYEDQGPPFVMEAGDCVLQPPGIRHRVLESSAGAEVVEVTAPAEHLTQADPLLELPTPLLRPERDFGGQRFVRHQAARAHWQPWRIEGFAFTDTGIAQATQGLAGVRVVRRAGSAFSGSRPQCHATELCFWFVLQGELGLEVDGVLHALGSNGSASLPGGCSYRFAHASPDLELLEVTLPAELDANA